MRFFCTLFMSLKIDWEKVLKRNSGLKKFSFYYSTGSKVKQSHAQYSPPAKNRHFFVVTGFYGQSHAQ